jgi:cobalt-zinc-cadmium efflux system protein
MSHDHAHDHSHSHSHAPKDFGRAFIIGIVLNSLFIAAEMYYGIVAESLALLADAWHNVSDVLGLILAWGATLLAKRAASTRYTYGLQSASILAALANAVLLLVAVVGIGWEAWERFNAPQAPLTETMMLVAGIGVVINGFTAWLFMRGTHDLNIRGAYLHMAADAGVSLGVVVAALVIQQTGWLWIDPAISIAIAVVIAVGTWGLLRESVQLSLQGVPRHVDTAAVSAFLQAQPGVAGVHNLHIWALSTSRVALSVHLLMPQGMPDGFLEALQHELEHEYGIGHCTVQIETAQLGACALDEGHHG